MRNLILAIAFLFTGTLIAQEAKPTFEKEGDLIKGTFFHDNGTIRQQGFYKDGKLHDEWVSYNNSGKKIAIGQYNKGVKNGTWFFLNNDTLSEVDYSNNTIANVITLSNTNNIASK